MSAINFARPLVLLLAVLLVGLPTLAGAASPAPAGSGSAPQAENSPEPDLALLRELASFQTKSELSAAEAERLVTLVEQLGSKHRIRRLVAHLLNRDGGRLDRAFNRVLTARAWRKHGPLPNLADVSAGVLRGGQPAPEGWAKLKAMGVRVVVNLRLEDESEREPVEALGLTYVSMPIPDTDAPTRQQALQFLRLCEEASPQARMFFHCASGSFRTGTMAALYRVEHGATAEEALAEAETFGWRESWLNADLEAAFVRRWAGKCVRPD